MTTAENDEIQKLKTHIKVFPYIFHRLLRHSDVGVWSSLFLKFGYKDNEAIVFQVQLGIIKLETQFSSLNGLLVRKKPH